MQGLLEKRSAVDFLVERFIEDINKAKDNVLIINGEASVLLYNRPELIDELFSAYKRGVSFTFSLGPVISVDGDGANELFDFAKLNELYVNKTRPLTSLRVIDGIYSSCDEPCLPFNLPRLTQIKEREQIFWAERFTELFDYFKYIGLVKKPESDDEFLLLNQDKIKGLYHLAENNGKSYDFMLIDGLKELSKKLQGSCKPPFV